jgi:hypothetical protein
MAEDERHPIERLEKTLSEYQAQANRPCSRPGAEDGTILPASTTTGRACLPLYFSLQAEREPVRQGKSRTRSRNRGRE